MQFSTLHTVTTDNPVMIYASTVSFHRLPDRSHPELVPCRMPFIPSPARDGTRFSPTKIENLGLHTIYCDSCPPIGKLSATQSINQYPTPASARDSMRQMHFKQQQKVRLSNRKGGWIEC